MKTNIDKFIALRVALQNEQATLQTRLSVIAKALGQSVPTPTSPSTPAATPGKRFVSEASRAKMRAAQQARRAGNAADKTTPTPVSTPKKRRKMSAATKAALSAGKKAWWAKKRAEKAAKAKK